MCFGFKPPLCPCVLHTAQQPSPVLLNPQTSAASGTATADSPCPHPLCLPHLLHVSPHADFRGERHCDGGLTNFIPLPPGTVGIRVCCFPSQQLSPVYRCDAVVTTLPEAASFGPAPAAGAGC